MSEQISGTHGRAEDDAIKRQDRGELRAYAGEWPGPESPDDDGSGATWAEAGRFAQTPGGGEWEAIKLRSDLARHLNRTSFPASRGQLLGTLTARQAEQRLLDLVSSLPAGSSFASLAELVRALGLPVEERPA